MGRRLLKTFGVTPARYEMLSGIRAIEELGETVTQKGLWEGLGLARATVCEMLGVLEKLKLVWRERSGRTKGVSLTRRGVEAFDAAYAGCVENGKVTMGMDAALGNIEVDAERTLGERLDSDARLREFFFDWATLQLHEPNWYDDYASAFAYANDRGWPELRLPFVDEI